MTRARDYRTEAIVPSRYYTPSSADRQVNIPRRTINNWIKSGALVATRCGRGYKFTGQRLIEAYTHAIERSGLDVGAV